MVISSNGFYSVRFLLRIFGVKPFGIKTFRKNNLSEQKPFGIKTVRNKNLSDNDTSEYRPVLYFVMLHSTYFMVTNGPCLGHESRHVQ